MLRFADFVLDPASRELRAGGAEVHLEPQAFDVLVYLAEHRDRVVDKYELLDQVWGHSHLSESNLSTRIKEIRRAVGDDGRQQHTIKNVRGRGYRFVATVATVAADPRPSLDRDDPASERLVGRDDDVRAVADGLRRSRLVTITGVGGVGKSSLAFEVKRKVASAYSDGAHLVELVGLAHDEDLLGAFCRSLDVVHDPERVSESLRSIAGVDALIVVDNCEHLADGVAQLLTRILRVDDGRVSILTTSQVPLGVVGETIHSIGPLSVDAAVELFRERARAVDAAWDSEVTGAERVTQLVAGLDLLPLTIEMAAGRVGSMTFDDLERAIAAGEPLLRMTHRSTERRHRSLGALVQWSVGLLDERERSVFTDLSVFSGPVPASDVAAVLDAPDPAGVSFELAALSERSLLVADRSESETTYSMLTTVRTVARNWLDASGRSLDVERRHAQHVARVLSALDSELRTPDELRARRRLASLTNEVRAAHRWARSHDLDLADSMSGSLFHAAYSSLWSEPASWVSRLADAPGATQPSAATRLLVAGAAAHRGDLVLARQVGASVERDTNGRLRAAAIELLADVALYQGDLVAAKRWAAALRTIGAELEDRHALAFSFVDRALALVYEGDPSAASRELDRAPSDGLAPTDQAWIAYARGDALSALGDRSASRAYDEAIVAGRSVGNHFVVAVSATALATELARTGALDQSLEVFHQVLLDYLRHGNLTHAVTALRNVIGLLAAIGDERSAVVLAGAMASGSLRVSYGAEAEGLADVLVDVARRVDPTEYRTWFEHGAATDVEGALRVAIEAVAVGAG